MPVKRLPPKDAAALIAEGYKYLDVRSIPEFEAGHPKGAYNVPLLHLQQGRMVGNPAFTDVVAKHFGKADKIVCGCKSGGRSLRAAEMLASLGYTAVVDMQGGYDGERDPSGRVIPGWRESGLPVETAAETGRAYKDLE